MRTFTEREMAQRFAAHCVALVDHWESVGSNNRDRLLGLLHSFFALLDGCAAGHPPYVVVPCPSPADYWERIGRQENYYEPVDCDRLPESAHDSAILHEVLDSKQVTEGDFE